MGSLFLIASTACDKLTPATLQRLSSKAPKKITIQTSTVKIPIEVELALTPSQWSKGLMFRKEMAEGHGMLFVYEKPSPLSFWMKNTLIPLDILFIASDFKIKTISENTPPCPPDTDCPSYPSLEPVLYVLELNGGTVAREKIRVGDQLGLE